MGNRPTAEAAPPSNESGGFWTRFENTVRRSGSSAAIGFEDRTYRTFDELRIRAAMLAAVLRGRGVGPGDRVVVLAANGPWFVELMLAAALAGFVLVPVNTRFTAPEIAYILKNADPSLVFVDGARREVLTGCDLSGVPVLDVEGDPAAPARPAPGAEIGDPVPADPDAPFLQLYTSGTTGHPKGAVLSQRSMAAVAEQGAAHLGPVKSGDVMLICLPMFHIAAIDLIAFALVRGATMIVLPEMVPARVVATVKQRRVNRTLLVPAVIRMVVEHLEEAEDSLPSLETLIFGASPMPEELIDRARRVMPGADLIHVYGLTETSGMVTWLPPEQIAGGQRLLSCGRALPPGEIAIVDEAGRPLPAGTVGEVAYRGPQTMRGYWRNPDATAKALRNGWFRTGDAGHLDGEGYLFLSDRIKDMIKSGGENVYPAEVENVILKHPAIADAAVIGLPDERWGEAVGAVVVPSAGHELALEELQAYARRELAGFKIPRRLEILDDLPRNGAGKIQKHVLRAMFAAR